MNTAAVSRSRVSVRDMAVWALICALAYISVALIRVPVVSFLKYEPKDAVLMIGGFIYGPLAAAVMSIVVSAVEMVTVSDTGWIGALMNVLSTCAFVCVASAFYRRKRTMRGALLGLAVGTVAMAAIMLLWNALITPLYMGVPRQAVMEMLLPVFLPFNLIKAVMNSALTLLLYKHVVTALRKARLVPAPQQGTSGRSVRGTVAVSLAAVVLLATAILVILAFQGVI
ncbi:MAG: ECF transporter S component [Acutalibacteraceae bacterium]|jgi:riboflavin transporter FmnP